MATRVGGVLIALAILLVTVCAQTVGNSGSSCTHGKISNEVSNAALARLNFYRQLAGLKPVASIGSVLRNVVMSGS
jgi:hypothetical protein